MFCLVQDNDSHWYVIPFHKSKEWDEYLNKMDCCWNEKYDIPMLPDWAEAVGGSPSLVLFTNYKIT